MSRLIVSHEQYDALCDQVIASVKDSGWLPDLVLGVSRGGLRLADALSRSLNRPMAVVVASSYGGASGQEQGNLALSASIASIEPVFGKVLLVDDLVDSGVTLEKLVQYVPTLASGPVHLKTAVIWVKPHATFIPEFFAEQLVEDRWIVQPFEQRDF